jgi:uncharacterized protein (DUF58 family)
MNEILKESKNFKLIFKASENLLSGKYNSKLKGDGLEFIDLKEYELGDNIRKIDWFVSARKQTLFVKEFLEEKDANHYVLLDTSRSMIFKEFTSKVLASSLLLSSFKEQNNFSIWFFNNKKIITNQLSKSKKNLMRYIYEISNIKYDGSNNLKETLNYLLKFIKKKSIISIITDEIELDEGTIKLLTILKQKHKLNYFHLYSSKERNLNEGFSSFEDIESGEFEIYDLSEKEIEDYKKEFDKSIQNIKDNLIQIGIRPFILDSEKEIDSQIISKSEVI